MSILARYVLRSFAIPALMCFLGLCALMLLFMSFDLIGACFDPKSNLTFSMALDFLGGTLSTYLEWLLPAVFLLATLYTMWQFCRHSELTAMRAGGIGLLTIVMPIVSLSILVALASYCNTEYYKPLAAARANIIKNSDFRYTGRDPIEGCGYQSSDGLRTWMIGELNIMQPEELRDVTITFYDATESYEGELRYPRQMFIAPLVKWMDNHWVLIPDRGASVREIIYDTTALRQGVIKDEIVYKTFKTLPGVTEEPRHIVVQNSNPELSSAKDQKLMRVERDRAGLNTTEDKLRDSYQRYNHYATPFSIILVTLFAIPAGIASGRQSVFRGILLAIGMFLSYYIVSALAMMLAVNDWLIRPALAVAIPPLVYGIAAFYLFRRVR